MFAQQVGASRMKRETGKMKGKRGPDDDTTSPQGHSKWFRSTDSNRAFGIRLRGQSSRWK
jgi:hypothetical protein